MRRFLNRSLFVCLICLSLLHPALSRQRGAKHTRQNNIQDLRKEIELLKQSQQQILKELKEIKEMLRSPQENVESDPAVDRLTVAGEPFKGSSSARVVIIEYSDFECVFCGRYARDTFPRIDDEYVRAGKVRYYFRDLPLPIHIHAFKAAESAHCAGEQGKFWEMHRSLFADQGALTPDGLSRRARELGLEADKFDQCLATGKYSEMVRTSIAAAERIKIDGTPALLIGVTDEAGEKIKIVRMMLGAQSYEDMKTVLDELLKSQPKESMIKPSRQSQPGEDKL